MEKTFEKIQRLVSVLRKLGNNKLKLKIVWADDFFAVCECGRHRGSDSVIMRPETSVLVSEAQIRIIGTIEYNRYEDIRFCHFAAEFDRAMTKKIKVIVINANGNVEIKNFSVYPGKKTSEVTHSEKEEVEYYINQIKKLTEAL